MNLSASISIPHVKGSVSMSIGRLEVFSRYSTRTMCRQIVRPCTDKNIYANKNGLKIKGIFEEVKSRKEPTCIQERNVGESKETLCILIFSRE